MWIPPGGVQSSPPLLGGGESQILVLDLNLVPLPQDTEQEDQVSHLAHAPHPPSTGHSPRLQDPVSVSVAIPVHSAPSFSGAGLEQVLVLVLVLSPPPQDAEQEDQVVH